MNVMSEAQELGLTTSATNVFGFGESIEDRITHMDKIRNLQDDSLSKNLVFLPHLLLGQFS